MCTGTATPEEELLELLDEDEDAAEDDARHDASLPFDVPSSVDASASSRLVQDVKTQVPSSPLCALGS
mgnify:CR=1 FL=1